jgi:V8-like Glu-specific endopeptidase
LDGCHDAQIYRQYAQALIETGSPTAAISVLDKLIERDGIEVPEREDACGVRGRAWKDIAVAARGKRETEARAATRQSFESYSRVHRDNPDAFYQGINQVAVAYWDRGFALTEEERQAALTTASSIFTAINALPNDKRTTWDIATAGEALVAGHKYEEAATWFRAYVAQEDIDSFALAGTVRQLAVMYGLDKSNEGQKLLAPLSARLLELPGGNLTISNSALQLMSFVPKAEFEKVLGDAGSKTYGWLQMGINAAKSVALITTGGRGVGTGFVIRGSDFNEGWGDELYVLTNAHVVSAQSEPGAIAPSDVKIRFELAEDENLRNFGVDVEKVIWESPSNKHDAAVLKLSETLPDYIKHISYVKALPELSDERKNRVYIIGHPGGNEISFSFEDNDLLDYDLVVYGDDLAVGPAMIHYRAPTERGSSGSPVFNGNWKAIGLHHAGSKEMRQLNGKLGTYAANEGIWIESIRRAITVVDNESG